ncbi:MAG TPA: NPCBM/NEW2 domain-containing protein [Kiritimatiellia bacterium]|nr:NPCBM/NEW2 domain-containing protein [Kiritimatiellia bacterium]HRU70866.1 NPCBM/NEW2 domain-containing protein [Kiritimatiellia bacterium]
MTAKAQSRLGLDELDLATMSCGWERPQARLAVDGNPLKIARKRFERGVGTHAPSWFAIDTGGAALRFEAQVGMDDEELVRGKGSAVFRVYADGRRVADSGVMHARQPARRLTAELAGAHVVVLEVSDAGDGSVHDHADWCDAFFTVREGAVLKPLPRPPTEQIGILTPPPPLEPRIHGARVFGVRPGHPVLFTIPVTGERPITFEGDGLPDGLTLDRERGILSGTVAAAGSYRMTFRASNALGTATRDWRLEVGARIALTPPMGWNSWNCFAHTVSDANIRTAAQAMVESGLIQHGWSYVNIDDYWQTCPSERTDTSLMGPARDSTGRILPNARFPDMAALCRDVHRLGLKIGLYSSPGPTTCGGCVGSWGHEEKDAQTYAEWGFDYLKYDWCSYAQCARNDSLRELMRPYLIMSRVLRAQPRDLVFSLCQYGMGHVPAWGEKAGGQCWRTTDDIVDTWESVAGIVQAQIGFELFAAPGAWNDLDMLVVGTVGWGTPHPTRLTPNEQYSHISYWCLLASPLLLGCDLTRLDPFTLNLLTNDEVLEVNQDPLGRQAVRVQHDDAQEIWAKPMSDGSTVAGLFNRGCLTRTVTLPFAALGLKGPHRLRDLWRQKDLGVTADTFEAEIPGHGVLLLKLASVPQP